ncbi:MAG: hypothetical protein WC477_07245 [Patescibacteria group bacterium]
MPLIDFVMQVAVRLARKTHTDKATLWALVIRVWMAIAGPISLVLIGRYFSIEVQGYYYTFASILALQLFAELGLSQVLVQFSSHEWIGLHLDEKGSVQGNNENRSRLASLVRFASLWFGIGALGLSVLLLAVGFVFFNQSTIAPVAVHWKAPWLCLVCATGLNFVLAPVWAILTGCGQIEKVNASRAFIGVAMNLAGWIAILMGSGLYTTVVTGAVCFIGGLVFLSVWYRNFFFSLLKVKVTWRIDWIHELLPMQSRIAISTLTSYFMYNIFNPILFRYHGPQAAARMGMSLAIGNAVSSVSSAWVETKAPAFGMLVAKKDYDKLDKVLKKVTLISTAMAIAGGCAVLLLFVVFLADHPFGQRVLPTVPFALILLVTIANQVIGALNTYLRAHRQEPTMAVTIFANVLCGLSTWWFGAKYSALGATIGYAAIVLLLQLPLVASVWFRCRRNWHRIDRQISV